MSADDLRATAEKLARFVREHPLKTTLILAEHGARIEAKAAQITPVDRGFLRRANESVITEENGAYLLTIRNRMVYARYQHDYPHKHHQPNARDHFIEIPFEAELPKIVQHLITEDMKELKE